MLYLENVVFPTEDQEWNFRMSVKRTSYTSLYPFYSLINTGLARLDFEPLTILHGGNGSGKTTALNVIAEKLGIRRSAPFNRSNFFEDYVKLCRVGIEEDALYLLDEPENSLSASRQIELAEYLEETVRYMGCQLIISTHSPFLLSMKGAKIYDLDARPADIKPWTELENVRAYYDFFMKHKEAFEA